MKAKQAKLIQLISFFVLFIGFVVIRYLLFNIHKMKQWPSTLFMACFAVLIICYLIKLKITPLATSIAYVVGFVMDKLLQTISVDAGGGTTTNMWIIWIVVIVIISVLSGITEYLIIRANSK